LPVAVPSTALAGIIVGTKNAGNSIERLERAVKKQIYLCEQLQLAGFSHFWLHSNDHHSHDSTAQKKNKKSNEREKVRPFSPRHDENTAAAFTTSQVIAD